MGSENQPFGWEILDLRYGGLRNRLETLHWRVCSYLDPNDKSVTSLPELEVETKVPFPSFLTELCSFACRAGKF
jgi:hypothetical protein